MIDKKISIASIERSLNILETIGVGMLLLLAFVFQFMLQELPCPLCLLQRAGFFMVAIGFLFNLRFGLRPSHYAISLLGALFTAFVALRQIALHIVPGTGAYGPSILGLHMYTWSFIAAMLIVICTTIILGADLQYLDPKTKPLCFRPIVHFLFACVLALAVLNFISVLAQCGLTQCPENPTHYFWHLL